MRLSAAVLCGLALLVLAARANPIEKREAEDLSPLNEVYVVEMEDDEAVDGDRGDRDKRKIGIVKLGVTNGIINFVFGKLDSFLDSKTRALAALDDANRVKNAAFGIDNTQSATGQFLSNLVSSKIQAATGSIGPVVNSATTFLQGATSGLTGAFASKLAPLTSIASGVAGGLAGGLSAGAPSGGGGASASAGVSAGGGSSVGAGGSTASILGNLLSSKIGSLSSLSQGVGGASGGAGGAGGGAAAGAGSGPSAGAGINLGAFANLGGGYDYPPPQSSF